MSYNKLHVSFVKLRDICDISSGQNAPQNSEDYCPQGFTFIKTSDLESVINDDNENNTTKITKSAITKYKLKQFPEQSVVFAKSGLSCKKNRIYVTKKTTFVVNHLCVLSNFSSDFLPNWIALFLKEFNVTRLIKDDSYPSIKLSDIGNIDIPVIDKAEQGEKFSEIESICSTIRNKKKQILNFDSLVKSRFMEMFTNVDKRKLSEMAEIIMGQSPDSKSYNESGNGVPFFQGKGDFGEKYTKIGHWTTSPTKTAKLNDVLMSVRAPVGPVNIASTDCCIGRGLCAIRAENGLTNSEFLYNALKVMEPEIALMGNGSTFKAINKKDVYSLLIPVASTQSQESFSKFASLIDKSRFVVHSRYFLWLNFTFVSSTIAYSRVVSILECPKRC